MDSFYAHISSEGIPNYLLQNTSSDYCAWRGVKCAVGRVIKVLYYAQQYGNYDIHSLPPTVVTIAIQLGMQRYTVRTRYLPQALESCYLISNQIYADPTEGHLFVVGWTSTHPWNGSGNRRFLP
ncbi:hypothetical protein XU18_3235 [Perkinsela sp. CCAP 1560/4]|nr:hypothetical protein XU18_4552 [Perkinsela sp. CCAP 1560/4]KNH05790.1 hypothetical protein XU18_3235 [Perkinsela sp. CCAP 1560/4]|eukprot:KNH04128.1 hypothetical protein XU18_4552 [Perkinsela sp. CCAP 1560/4]